MPGLMWRGLVSCMLGIVRSGARVRCVYKMMDHQIHSVHLESFITVNHTAQKMRSAQMLGELKFISTPN